MQIGFSTNELCALCNCSSSLIKSLGDEIGGRVMDLLHFLDAAPTLADLGTAPPVLRKGREGHQPAQFSVGQEGNGQVLFSSMIAGLDLTEIDRVNIISVGGKV